MKCTQYLHPVMINALKTHCEENIRLVHHHHLEPQNVSLKKKKKHWPIAPNKVHQVMTV